MKIGIIGAGWYGCHIALELKKEGHDVTLFEKHSDIMQGISGEFGIRLHKGPHYPRSEATRASCLESFDAFCAAYPELLVEHEYSIYALGTTDAQGKPPKVDLETFIQVCHESLECTEIKPASKGYTNLQSVMTLNEPSIILGNKLREIFRKKLLDAQISTQCNYTVEELSRSNNRTLIKGIDGTQNDFDYAVNATSYQSLIPESFKTQFPIPMEVVYQPCLALRYKDTIPSDKPVSFIVMDGWFPCLMPTVADDTKSNEYIMTHGSYTIMGSESTPDKAYAMLSEIDDNFISLNIRSNTEREMHRFWPGFSDRFEYLGWKGTVLAKLRTQTEFRSAITFEHQGVIYTFPGKVSNVINAAVEVKALVNNNHCMTKNDFRFMEHGVLYDAKAEIEKIPARDEQSTCNLDTFRHFKWATQAAKANKDTAR
jgi:hypothetical protein